MKTYIKDIWCLYREVPPIIEERIDFKNDRTKMIETAYCTATDSYTIKELNELTYKIYNVVKYPKFYGRQRED